MTTQPVAFSVQSRLREYLRDALLLLAQYSELRHYPLPADLQPEGIRARLADQAVALLPELALQDEALERLIIDVYDARGLPVEDLERDLRRIAGLLGEAPRTPANGRLRHVFTVPMEMPVEIVILRGDDGFPWYAWPKIRIGAGHGNARYWMVRNPHQVEVGLSSSGRLRDVDIVHYHGLRSPEADPAAIPVRTQGVPVFAVDLWDDSDWYLSVYYSTEGELRLELAGESLAIRVAADSPAYRVAVSDRLSCEFNTADELCSFTVWQLSTSEIAHLQQLAAREAETGRRVRPQAEGPRSGLQRLLGRMRKRG